MMNFTTAAAWARHGPVQVHVPANSDLPNLRCYAKKVTSKCDVAHFCVQTRKNQPITFKVLLQLLDRARQVISLGKPAREGKRTISLPPIPSVATALSEIF